jgi:hypothetical protein
MPGKHFPGVWNPLPKRLRKKCPSRRSAPPAAESRIDFLAVTARVELVPFPIPFKREFFRGLLKKRWWEIQRHVTIQRPEVDAVFREKAR